MCYFHHFTNICWFVNVKLTKVHNFRFRAEGNKRHVKEIMLKHVGYSYCALFQLVGTAGGAGACVMLTGSGSHQVPASTFTM